MKKISILMILLATGCHTVPENKSNNHGQLEQTASAQEQQDPFAREWQITSAKIAELGPWLMSQPGILKDDPQVVSDGYRYLYTLLYAWLHNHLLNADTDRPKFISNWDDFAAWGCNQRDAIFRCANIDPKGTYRLVRKPQGGLPVTATIQGMNNFWITDTVGKILSTKNIYDYEAHGDGSYEVILSKEKPVNGNFFQLSDSTTGIIIREYLADDEIQKRFRLSIERIDQPLAIPLESDSEEELARKVSNAINMVKNVAGVFLNMTRLIRQTVNGIKVIPDISSYGGSLENKYYYGSWELGPDEALLLEMKTVEAAYWSFTASNFWCQALSPTDFPEEVNNYDAVTDPDGKIRILITINDPGYANWISTGGLKVGTITGRFNYQKEEENISCKRVKLSDLETLIVANSVKVAPAERERELRKTRMEVLDRYNRKNIYT